MRGAFGLPCAYCLHPDAGTAPDPTRARHRSGDRSGSSPPCRARTTTARVTSRCIVGGSCPRSQPSGAPCEPPTPCGLLTCAVRSCLLLCGNAPLSCRENSLPERPERTLREGRTKVGAGTALDCARSGDFRVAPSVVTGWHAGAQGASGTVYGARSGSTQVRRHAGDLHRHPHALPRASGGRQGASGGRQGGEWRPQRAEPGRPRSGVRMPSPPGRARRTTGDDPFNDRIHRVNPGKRMRCLEYPCVAALPHGAAPSDGSVAGDGRCARSARPAGAARDEGPIHRFGYCIQSPP